MKGLTMKKKPIKIDWKKVWIENCKWFRKSDNTSWLSQKKNIRKLIEEQLKAI